MQYIAYSKHCDVYLQPPALRSTRTPQIFSPVAQCWQIQINFAMHSTEKVCFIENGAEVSPLNFLFSSEGAIAMGHFGFAQWFGLVWFLQWFGFAIR
jgi:hypothetical protein